jgi:ribosomal protein S4
MSSHQRSSLNIRYRLIRRYQKDYFGFLVSKGIVKRWDEESQSYRVFLKNVKAVKYFILKRFVDKYNRRKEYFLKKSKDKLFFSKKKEFIYDYRVDKINLKKKKKKFKLFTLQLKNRQRMRFFATTMPLKQYKNYVKKATSSPRSLKKFYELFERRVDVILYRLNMMTTAMQGRQSILHKNFLINNKITIFPSQGVKFFDVLKVKNRKKYFNYLLQKLKNTNAHIKEVKKLAHQKNRKIKKFKIGEVFMNVPAYLEVNYRIMSVMFVFYPKVKHVFFPFKIRKSTSPLISSKLHV